MSQINFLTHPSPPVRNQVNPLKKVLSIIVFCFSRRLTLGNVRDYYNCRGEPREDTKFAKVLQGFPALKYELQSFATVVGPLLRKRENLRERLNRSHREALFKKHESRMVQSQRISHSSPKTIQYYRCCMCSRLHIIYQICPESIRPMANSAER